ncbi:hypothetical protein [Nocardia brasiliensis]|uniref:hypothetical protein n=1 Tax=Nocardia brasiliensis TaxID=37326 RepID=UPI002455D486|nr:hypothetical protein [Nocardia brasiliensis]
MSRTYKDRDNSQSPRESADKRRGTRRQERNRVRDLIRHNRFEDTGITRHTASTRARPGSTNRAVDSPALITYLGGGYVEASQPTQN